jgi:hypothetical protein
VQCGQKLMLACSVVERESTAFHIQ